MRVYSPSPKEINFGVLLLKLDSKGKELHGYGLLSGLDNPKISFAQIDLKLE